MTKACWPPAPQAMKVPSGIPSGPGVGGGPRLRGEFGGSERHGGMRVPRRPAVKSGLNEYVTHDAPDTHAVAPRSEALAGATAGHEAGRG